MDKLQKYGQIIERWINYRKMDKFQKDGQIIDNNRFLTDRQIEN